MGLFACLICRGKLPAFIVLGISLGGLLLEMKVYVLDGKVVSSLLHAVPEECDSSPVGLTHELPGDRQAVTAQVCVDGDSLRVVHEMERMNIRRDGFVGGNEAFQFHAEGGGLDSRDVEVTSERVIEVGS